MAILNKWLLPLAPALIAFGPLFIAMGVPGPYHSMSALGALATSLGTLILFVKIQYLEHRIEELRGRLDRDRA